MQYLIGTTNYKKGSKGHQSELQYSHMLNCKTEVLCTI